MIRRKVCEDITINYKALCNFENGILVVKNVLPHSCDNTMLEYLLCMQRSL